MAASGGMPYYTTVARIRDPSDTDISLVTLPAGTILFRGIKLPTENPLAFYTDYLGTPAMVNGTPTLCLKPTHNVFFYAHPMVCFGAHNVGPLFDAVQVVVLVKNVNVICMIRPSSMVRGEGKRYSGNSPIQRCSNFKESCGELTEDALQQLSYDNCLSPAYQRRSFTRGWMAIANLDSIEPKLEEEGELHPTMGPYLKGLEKRLPGVGSLLAASTYVDATRTEKGKNPRTGFPEIVLYPYATAPGDTNLHQPCSSDVQAMALLAKQAKKDNLLYLPIATITAKGIVDMIGGHFSSQRVTGGGDQRTIETNLTRYLNTSMRYGVRLPFYGNGAISFDMRTGFYILPQVAEGAYRANILPVDSNQPPATRKAQHASLRKYLVSARSYSQETYGSEISLPTGTVPNAFIFSRPILLAPIFKSIGISLPKDMYEYLKELSDAFKASRAPLRISVPKPPAPIQMPGRTPLGTPRAASPPFRVEGYTPQGTPRAASPPFRVEGYTPQGTPPASPPFRVEGYTPEGTPEYGPSTPAYGPTTPNFAPTTPTFPPEEPKGGYRKTRHRGRSAGVTRKRSNPIRRYAQQFSSLWKIHATNKN
jgi:hypothetical protein